MRLLIVDDQVEILAMFQVLLADWGFELDTASSYSSAIQLLEQNTYACVLTDIDLNSQADGWTVAQIARKLNRKTKIGVMSGGNWRDMAIARKYRFFQKPVSLRDLSTWLNYVFEEGGGYEHP